MTPKESGIEGVALAWLESLGYIPKQNLVVRRGDLSAAQFMGRRV